MKNKSFYFLLGILVFLPSISIFGQNNWELPLRQCWVYLSSPAHPVFASDNAKTLFFSDENQIKAISNTGDFLWENSLQTENIILNIQSYQKGILILTLSQNNQTISIYNLSQATGLILWKQELPPPDTSHETTPPNVFLDTNHPKPLLFVKDRTFLLNDQTGIPKLLIPSTGDLNELPLSQEDIISIPNKEEKPLLFSVSQSKFLKPPTTSIRPSQTTLFRNSLLVSDTKGNIILQSKEKVLWSFKTGAKVTDLLFNQNNLGIISNDNYLYWISAQSGKLLWKKRFQNRLLASQDSTYNILFVAINNEKTLFILNAQNGRTLNQIDLQLDDYFTHKPIIWGDTLFTFSQNGITAFSPNQCKQIEKAGNKLTRLQ